MSETGRRSGKRCGSFASEEGDDASPIAGQDPAPELGHALGLGRDARERSPVARLPVAIGQVLEVKSRLRGSSGESAAATQNGERKGPRVANAHIEPMKPSALRVALTLVDLSEHKLGPGPCVVFEVVPVRDL